MILLIYTFYQILALSHTGQATLTAPIEPLLSAAAGNRTTLNTQISPLWALSSGVRGTSDILWSCLLTLTSCVYTAIHLNVPPAGEGKWQRLRRKLHWVMMALFIPKRVLHCALEQLVAAQELVNGLNKLWASQHALENDVNVKRRAQIRTCSRISLFRSLNPFAWRGSTSSSGHNLEKDVVSIGTYISNDDTKEYRPPAHLENFPYNTGFSRAWAASLLICPSL